MAAFKTHNFLPEIFQTETNKKFLNATVDQLVTEPNFKRVSGYIGRKFEYGKVYSDPFASAFKPTNEGEDVKKKDGGDHEVHMAQSQLDTIIQSAQELKNKMGENEKDVPAWIQDHISNAENYITQASSGYYEYKGENESIVTEAGDSDLIKIASPIFLNLIKQFCIYL